MRFLNRISWKVALGVSLIVMSAILYSIHYLVFGDAHHIFIYLLGDVAFLPIEVFLVTIVVHQLLTERERRVMLKKLNMVIGAFFSEVGTRLLKGFVVVDAAAADKRTRLAAAGSWPERNIKDLVRYFKACECMPRPSSKNLDELKALLAAKRVFLLGLLENPNLLEHESFTEMLWAVFHLAEELEAREDFSKLPASDLKHLEGDIKRAYTTIAVEWLWYMDHLRRNYPYLFSLAVRTNPFDSSASVIVK
ncbi:MAG: hypothetical protein WC674_03450 [Candidatus Krumholzibacteriia bacterium]